MASIGKTSYEINLETPGIDEVIKFNSEVRQMQEELSVLGEDLTVSDEMMIEWAGQLGLSGKEVKKLQEITAHNKQIEEFANKTGFAAGEVKRLVEEMKKGKPELKGFMDQLGAAAKLVGAAKLGQQYLGMAKEMTGAAAAQEDLNAAMKTMLGDGDKAKELIASLENFAGLTPYNADMIVDAGKALLSSGVAADSIIPTLQKMGDVAAGAGISIENMADIYGRATEMGAMQAADLNGLFKKGVPIFDELAKVMGTTAANVKKLAASGGVSLAHFEEALQSLSGEGGKYSGMMKELSANWNGLSQKLDDNIGDIKKGIGEMIMSALKPLLEYAVEFTSWIKQNEPAMIAIKILFTALGAVIGVLLVTAVKAAIVAFGGMAVSLFGVAAAGFAATAPFLPLLLIIGAVAFAVYLLVKNFDAVSVAIDNLSNFIGEGVVRIGEFFSQLGAKIAEPFVKAYNFIKKTSAALLNYIKSIPGRIVDFFKSIPGRIMAAFAAFKQKLLAFLKDILPESVWNFFLKFTGSSGKAPEGRAAGGPVTGGTAFMVGEKGPELFVPPSDGKIIPNSDLKRPASGATRSAGAVNITFNATINASGVDAGAIKRAVEEAFRGMLPAMREKLNLGAV